MYLYPFNIFSISKNKRLLTEKMIPTGIYNPVKGNYNQMVQLAEKNDCCISVLLGNITKDVRLICLDLDDCYDEDGNLDQQTAEFLKEFDEYEYETSSSGTGIHIYILTKMDFDTFIVKDMEGCKSFECYTRLRHIVVTSVDFLETDFKIGKHDEFLKKMLDKVEQDKKDKMSTEQMVKDINQIFDGQIVNTMAEVRGKVYKRTPVDKISKIREIAFKDISLRNAIDMSPDCVDQSQHDAKLVRKLMYYTLSFESAWEMAKKTNYYQAKDKKHKEKFDNPRYIQRTRDFIMSGKV